ncbi:MAG: helix-turn-helix domain-containing protein [Bacteroidales bacterium]|nr:helix-turn-helix domain-containing protein [Bacteroidales bacterium]
MLRNRKPSEKELLLELKEKINAIEHQLNEPIIINREWIEPKELASILHIARRTLADYSRRGYLPYSRLGGRVYYRLSDVNEYLSAHIIRKQPQS